MWGSELGSQEERAPQVETEQEAGSRADGEGQREDPTPWKCVFDGELQSASWEWKRACALRGE